MEGRGPRRSSAQRRRRGHGPSGELRDRGEGAASEGRVTEGRGRRRTEAAEATPTEVSRRSPRRRAARGVERTAEAPGVHGGLSLRSPRRRAARGGGDGGGARRPRRSLPSISATEGSAGWTGRRRLPAMGGAAARGTGSCRTPEAWAGWQGGGLLLVSCQGISHAPSSSHIGGCWCFCVSLPSRRWSRPAWGGAVASAVEASEGRSGGCDVGHDQRGDERWRRFLGFGYHIL
jgi:hypothetical protein